MAMVDYNLKELDGAAAVAAADAGSRGRFGGAADPAADFAQSAADGFREVQRRELARWRLAFRRAHWSASAKPPPTADAMQSPADTRPRSLEPPASLAAQSVRATTTQPPPASSQRPVSLREQLASADGYIGYIDAFALLFAKTTEDLRSACEKISVASLAAPRHESDDSPPATPSASDSTAARTAVHRVPPSCTPFVASIAAYATDEPQHAALLQNLLIELLRGRALPGAAPGVLGVPNGANLERDPANQEAWDILVLGHSAAELSHHLPAALADAAHHLGSPARRLDTLHSAASVEDVAQLPPSSLYLIVCWAAVSPLGEEVTHHLRTRVTERR